MSTTEGNDEADPGGDKEGDKGGGERDCGDGRAWSRRGLIAGAAAAGIGAAAVLVFDGSEAGAANGGNVILGATNSATATTEITTTTGTGFVGATSDYGSAGLFGTSSGGNSAGVSASDTSTAGSASSAMEGYSVNNVGVTGIGYSESGIEPPLAGGVVGDTSIGAGVTGLSSSHNGVYGATSEAGYSGVAGTDASTSGGVGVTGTSTAGTGVGGRSTTGAAVSGVSVDNYGVVASGGLALLLLTPSGSVGPPPAGAHVVGELYTDTNGALYYCVDAGTPGTWLQVASAGPSTYAQGAFCLLPAPIRLLDTRLDATAPDHPGTPVIGGETITVPITGQSVGGISVPAGAVAVIGNVTAVGAATRGYLTLWPDGVTQPGTSSLNFPATTSVANGVTVALSVTGKLNIYASQTTDVIFDATGFIA